MIVVLAEKPSVGRDLARFLGCTQRCNGYFEGNGYQVTWAFGHLATLKDAGEYDAALKRWRLETLPFIPEEFQLKVVKNQGSREQFSVIKTLFKSANELICATDAGREGELIFRQIQHLSGCTHKPFRRLWLSSLTDAALRQGFQNLRLGQEYDGLYAAARCRSEADWIVGINATRAFTVRHGARTMLWTIGRVQTPLLAMIVNRDDEIRRFASDAFWELRTKYRNICFKHTAGRFNKHPNAQARLEQITDQPFTVTRVEAKREATKPPLLFDLTTLQREANRRFGLSAAETLAIAQKLYEAKYLSYPRTDSRFLGSDAKSEISGIFRNLQNLKPTEIGRLNLEALPFSGRIINDAKVTDHHAIIPTGTAPRALDSRSQQIYDVILTRFIAVFYPDCIKEVTRVTGRSVNEEFRARGSVLVDPGWTAVEVPPKRKPKTGKKGEQDEDAQQLPIFTMAETGAHAPYIHEGATQPPKPFTENTLLSAMETAGRQVDDEQLREALKERGLGTPATRAAMIETLLARGYVERVRKSIRATDTGRFLIALIPHKALTSAELTGDWECKLKKMEQSTFSAATFMTEITNFIHAVIQEPPPAPAGSFGTCPSCGHPIIKGKTGYGCSAWQQGCSFAFWGKLDEHQFSETEIRTLLARRALPKPISINSQDRLVALNDHGEAIAIEPIDNRKKSSKRSSKSKPHRANASKKTHPPAPPTTAQNPTVATIGDCPLCGAPVISGNKAYGCSAWNTGCGFRIWKTIAGKRISLPTVKALLKNKKTNILKGFTSKAGKPFDAALRLQDGKTIFDFP